MEDDAAARRRRVPHCRQGGRCGRAGRDADRARPALAVGLADAVHWLGLFPRRRASSDRGLSVEASLFRLGARAYRQARGGDRAAGGHRDGRRSHDLAQPSRRGIRPRVRESEGDSRRDRPLACQGRRGHSGCARNRLLPADDGGLATSEAQMAATIRLQREPIDAANEAAKLRRGRGDIGAVVTFTGICRSDEGGAPLAAMTLEHYPGMAEAEVACHVEAAERRWPLLGVTAAAHRQDAFAAAEFLMDYLKTRAPFWKQIEFAANEKTGGKIWVDAKQSDDALAERWTRAGTTRAAE